MQPIELVLRGAPRTGVELARIAAHDKAWLRLDGEPQTSPGWREVPHDEVAVAEVRDGWVRILHEEDDVRVLLWIARSDLARVIVRDVELGPRVLLRAGLRVGGDVISAEGLSVLGSVDDGVVGDLWDAVALRPAEGTLRLRENAKLFAAPGGGPEVLAITQESIAVQPLGEPSGGWREIETIGPRVIVRGFVAETDLGDAGLIHGSGHGYGYGSSHSISIDVPAGTCLYDAIGGEMIGITTMTRSRLAHRTDDEAWYHVLVNSPWGLLDIPIHDGGDGWDRCADL